MERTKLTVLYDSSARSVTAAGTGWLPSRSWWQSSSSPQARPLHRRVRRGTGIGKELVVVNDDRNAWEGPSAFLMCLWATARYRSWAFRFTEPGFERFAERFFLHVSKRRGSYAAWLAKSDPDCAYCDDVQTRRGA
jgi:hypothetical protein